MGKQGKAKMLVANDNVTETAIEGTPKGTIIIIEFESRDIAKEFYYSKEYQEVLALRTDNSDGWAAIVDGFEL